MTTAAREGHAEQIESVVSLAHERLPPDVAAVVAEFARQYYGGVAAEDLAELAAQDAYGAAVSHWQLARDRRPGEMKVRVYTPKLEEHGWQSTHTAVEVVTDDMPFLVDSVSMELTRQGFGIHLVVRPVVRVRRDAAGTIVDVLPPDADADAHAEDTVQESLIHAEIDRVTEPEALDALRDDLLRVLGDVEAAVEDWPAMREQARRVAADLEEHPPPVDPEDVEEAKALLRWIHDDNFTFLGYREYELHREDGEDVLRARAGTGLGILRDTEAQPASRSFARLSPTARRLAREKTLLNLTKANSRSTVHRAVYLDHVGVKEYDASGEPVAERRFLGLYTSVAYRARPQEIPILRRRVARILDRSGLVPGGHDYKSLVDILETYPRDELFQIAEDELLEIATGILHLGERKRVRLFVRRDAWERFLSCLVFVPREAYTTQTRLRIQEILQEAFGAPRSDFAVQLSESALARVHFVLRPEEGTFPEYDVGEIERRLAETVRSWTDDLREALVSGLGEERGVALFRKYGDAFPPAYRDDFPARMAVPDIERMEGLGEDDVAMTLYRPLHDPRSDLAFKLVRTGRPILLSDVLPHLENMGVKVVDERPYEIAPAGGETCWVYDFGLTHDEAAEVDAERLRGHFQDAFEGAWSGQTESDGFNRLVLGARLSPREVTVIRAYCKYLRQTASPYSQGYMEEALRAHPEIASQLVRLFRIRHDPAGDAAAREAQAGDAVARLERALDEVQGLDEDRILRGLLRLVLATLRTNYFQRAADGGAKPYLSFKLDPALIPDLPRPRPQFEIFVYSPRMEGVHLRAGRVARGGIRWSDRREDFRTEVLGLMKAQTVKNAVIVPVGAKGGFVVKRPPPGGDRAALQEEVVACYRTLMSGMLDLTDNIVERAVVPPADVVRYDEDDTYLVVAADKGTATFSDIANGIALEYGFWLGDAFASGGSTGYDHKKMGITARGAWESVKRHFRELGVDIQETPFTVVGIGDMSGDVFGNGMLLSPAIKLVGAFDHRHVFLDPDPDPGTSFAERKRLFDLGGGSSWADYDAGLVSEGGGVFPRTAKSIPLSPQARRALETDAEALTPDEVVSALLRAPVDLLWNGGVGTFVKAASETAADVADKANDAVRVDATDLRCRVVGEGGNLGFTQLARVEFAQAGGRICTDFIDNSAGVDCSDHEVNIKILLDMIVAQGDLTERQRNELIAEMTDEVAELVLRDNYGQTEALSLASAQTASMLDVHARLIDTLEASGRLDRRLEFLPDAETIQELRNGGAGLTTPELALLLAYSKAVVHDELLASDVPEDPYLARDLERYFPTRLSERYRDHLERHPLRRELVATFETNSMVNRAGSTFAFRVGAETGASAAEITRAYTVARDVFDLRSVWAASHGLGARVPADTQIALLLEARKLVERATRWLLHNRRQPLDIAATVDFFAPGAAAVARALPDLLAPPDRDDLQERAAALERSGVPAELALRVAGLQPLLAAFDIVDVASATGLGTEEVASAYFALGTTLDLQWLRDRIADLPRADRWQTLARAALRDDLNALQRQLATDVLLVDASGPVPARLEAWETANRAAVERARAALHDIRVGGLYNVTTLSVAIREVRALGAPGALATGAAPTGDGRGAEAGAAPAPVAADRTG